MQEALEYEAVIVNEKMLNNPLCYNLRKGGTGGDTYSYQSTERKEARSRKISETIHNKPEKEKEEIAHKLRKTTKVRWENTTKSEKEEHGRKISEAYQNKTDSEKKEHSKNCSEATKLVWENKTETEKEEWSQAMSKAAKIASNIKYKCPYDDYVNIASWVGIYIRKNHSDKKQWKDYTKEEKQLFFVSC